MITINYQDSPSAKVTVETKITLTNKVKCVFVGPLLKTEEHKENGTSTYFFEQKNLIPTYLIVFAAGDMEFASMTERTGIWAEKDMLTKACYEFQNADLFIRKVNFCN